MAVFRLPVLAAALAGISLVASCGQGQSPSTQSAPTDRVSSDANAADSDDAESVLVDSVPRGIIDEQNLRFRISTLSSDEFEGRAPATLGGDITREFLVNEMKAIGLQPANGDSYEQPVPLVEITADPQSSYLRIGERTLAYGPEAVFWTKKAVEEIAFDDSDVVFVGYGVVAPEYGWNDYEGIDVTGKTVVMLINDPGFATQDESVFNGEAMTYYGRWTYKYEEAARQGAAAAIIVHQAAPAAYGWGVVEGSWSGAQLDLERPDAGASRIPMEGWIQADIARALFSEADQDFDALAAAAVKKSFKPVTLGSLKASGRISNSIRRSVSANVAGILPGSVYPDEYVLYMGHWDHLGVGVGVDGDTVSNGAVDNATGTAGILSIAEAFANNGSAPERSILFLAVTAEESGLLGSAYFAEAPLVPFKQIVGGINIDAILPTPPTRDLIVVGFGSSELEDLLKIAADQNGQYLRPDAEPEKGFFYRSDHISLAKKGVPMLYADSGIDFVDGGEAAGRAFSLDYNQNRYHKPADEYSEDWDMRGMLNSLQLFYQTGAMMAYTDMWPNWYEGNEFRALRDRQRNGE